MLKQKKQQQVLKEKPKDESGDATTIAVTATKDHETLGVKNFSVGGQSSVKVSESGGKEGVASKGSSEGEKEAGGKSSMSSR